MSASRDQTTASPTPPFVLAGKTLPVQARLTTSHASSQNLLPMRDLCRQASPIETQLLNSGGDGGAEVGGGSLESATSLLQSLKEKGDDSPAQKRRKNLLFGSSSPTSRASLGSSPVNKRYVKMGILMSESLTEVSTYRSYQFNSNSGRSAGSPHSPSRSQTPPFSGVEKSTGMVSRSRQMFRQGTPPNHQSSDYLRRNSPNYSSPRHSEGVLVNMQQCLGDGLSGDAEIKEEGYEVIDLKDVGTMVDSTNRGFIVTAQNAQPSPPISMKSESVSVNSEESASSPDSGYGNTPEYPNPNANGEAAKSIEETAQQNGMRDLHCEGKLRADSDDTDGGLGKGTDRCHPDHSVANGRDDNRLLALAQHGGRNGVGGGEDSLTRPSTGSSSSTVISDCSSSEQRSRGDTNESLFSAESIISSPPVQSSVSGTLPSRTGEEDIQLVAEKQQTKMFLGRLRSLPPGIRMDANMKSLTTPRAHPDSAGPFRFHASPSSEALNYYGTRHPNYGSRLSMTTNPSGFSELHPSHPSHPSQPHPYPVTAGGGVAPSQSSHNIHRQARRSPEPRRRKLRSTSLAFNRSTGIVYIYMYMYRA